MNNFNICIAQDRYTTTRGTEDRPVEVWVTVYSIVAEHENGRRWALRNFASSDEQQAKAALATIETTPDSMPDEWLEIEPRYGSESWGAEDEYALACFEADAYGEPRPRW